MSDDALGGDLLDNKPHTGVGSVCQYGLVLLIRENEDVFHYSFVLNIEGDSALIGSPIVFPNVQEPDYDLFFCYSN